MRPAPQLPSQPPAAAGLDGSLSSLIEDLLSYQRGLESQNKFLRYSQASAEAASERFETLFSSVPLALMVLDEHDMVVQSNAMALRLFQPTRHDRSLVSLMPFVSDAHVAPVAAAFAEARDAGQAEVTEIVFTIGEDGHTLTGDLHIRRLETPASDGGEPLRQYICAVIDQGPLLAQRRALQQSAEALRQRNEQLYQSESRLEAVINSALDAIVCVDQHQRITVFNPTAAALFHCPTEQALGSPLARFLPDAARALDLTQISSQAMLGEMSARTADDKPLAVEVSVSFERHAEGETTTVFARDLTGRKKAEAQRAVLETQLRESQKMQAMGTMAGGIAHDFNNILSAILGNTELALADLAPDAPARVSLHEIDKAGRRARDLVRQILTFSRDEPPRLASLDLTEVVHETERLLRVTLPPAIELRLNIAAGLPAVLADATQVEQALLNLCTNAIHAIGEERGQIAITLTARQLEPRIGERLGLAPGPYLALTVLDTGKGIAPETLRRIFEPFFTTKQVGQGTGLGLSVVHGVMRTHQGAVDVQSAPGQGSLFTLYFPITAATVPEAAPPEETAPQARPPQVIEGRGRHVMYVDDDQALVFLVERLLTRKGFRVTGLSDPRAAAAALRADPGAYDLLVTDYNMPGYCGVDLVREAHSIRPDLPVALASGYVTAEIEAQARAEGARALIHKPNDVEELCATVQQLVDEA